MSFETILLFILIILSFIFFFLEFKKVNNVLKKLNTENETNKHKISDVLNDV